MDASANGEGDDHSRLLPHVLATVIPRPRGAYNDLAVPIKLYDYLAYGRPLLVTDCEVQARVVNDASTPGSSPRTTCPRLADAINRVASAIGGRSSTVGRRTLTRPPVRRRGPPARPPSCVRLVPGMAELAGRVTAHRPDAASADRGAAEPRSYVRDRVRGVESVPVVRPRSDRTLVAAALRRCSSSMPCDPRPDPGDRGAHGGADRARRPGHRAAPPRAAGRRRARQRRPQLDRRPSPIRWITRLVVRRADRIVTNYEDTAAHIRQMGSSGSSSPPGSTSPASR